ncbi:MAG TPA: nickel-dependent lactate racemase [Vicinamibacterales bacterium]|nr:nickel-dependent lactate racemase [Vicinamibacterales bacterium]
MRVQLDYGSNGLGVDLPEERTVVVAPRHTPAVSDPEAAVRAALREPTAGPPLASLVKTGDTVAISVCDITRAQPRALMLQAIFAELPQVDAKDVTILIATGTHRANTRDELVAMLGADIVERYAVVNHDGRDKTALACAGTTDSGVPVWLNRRWLDAAVRITTGFVEPHFFAGFSGGPKMVAPGLAGLDTVLRLHDARHVGHPKATWGITKGNPIHDDVREIARFTGVTFALDVSLNRDQAITKVFAGELFAEHAAACAHVRATAMCPVDGLFDVVLTTNSGYPLDQNLYQSVKGMSAAAGIVKPGGTIICAAECRDGVPSHGAYGAILRERSSPAALLEMIEAPTFVGVPDAWQVQVQALIQAKATVLVKAGGLTLDAVRAAHFEPVTDVAMAVRGALSLAGPEASLAVLPHGPQTIPYVVTPPAAE